LAISHNCWADIKLKICKIISCGNSKKGIVPIILHSKEPLFDLDSVSKELGIVKHLPISPKKNKKIIQHSQRIRLK
jgi:hypothetical protein